MKSLLSMAHYIGCTSLYEYSLKSGVPWLQLWKSSILQRTGYRARCRKRMC